MTRERVELGFGEALDDFNPTDWPLARPRAVKLSLKREDTAKAAAVSGFKSREAKHSVPPKEKTATKKLRRRRTGRNAQFNLKAKPETIKSFCMIADTQEWGLGETLEYAVALLEQKYSKR